MYANASNAGKEEVNGYYYTFTNGSISMYKGTATGLSSRWDCSKFKTLEGNVFKINRKPGVMYRNSFWLDYRDIESAKRIFRVDLEKKLVAEEQKVRRLRKKIELLTQVNSVIGINTRGINSNK